MKKYIYITILFVYFAFEISAQESYYVKNDTLYHGAKITTGIGKDRFHTVFIKLNKEEFKYTPEIISEFGTDKRVYIAKILPSSKEQKYVFMEQLISVNNIAIFHYADGDGSYFYIQEGKKELQLITEENNLFIDFLDNNYGSCSEIDLLKKYHIKYTTHSLLHANKIYSTCNPNLITRFRFGVMAGGGMSFISANDLPESKNLFQYYAGLFAEIPLYKNIGLRPEIYFLKDAVVSSIEGKNSYTDVTYNRETLAIPILIKYSFLFIKGRTIPYIHLGPIVNIGLKKEIESRRISYSDPVTTFFEDPIKKNGYIYAGASFGVGLEFKLNLKHSLFTDLRYNLTEDKGTNSIILFNVSFNF